MMVWYLDFFLMLATVHLCRGEEGCMSSLLNPSLSESDTDPFRVPFGASYLLPDITFPCDGEVAVVALKVLTFDESDCYSEFLNLSLNITLWKKHESVYKKSVESPIVLTYTMGESSTTSSQQYDIEEGVLSNLIFGSRDRFTVSAGDVLGIAFPEAKTINDSLCEQAAIPLAWTFNYTSRIFRSRKCLDPAVTKDLIDCHAFIRRGLPLIKFSASYHSGTTNRPTDTAPASIVSTDSTTSDSLPSSSVALGSSSTFNAALANGGGVYFSLAAAFGALLGLTLLVLVVVVMVVVVVAVCFKRRRVNDSKSYYASALGFSNPGTADALPGVHGTQQSTDMELVVYESPNKVELPGVENDKDNATYNRLSQSGGEKCQESETAIEASYSSISSYSTLQSQYQYSNSRKSAKMDPIEEDGKYSTVGASTEERAGDKDYWKPAETKEAIYSQITKKKYKEIPENAVTVNDLLGEGEFGQVFKGEWLSPTGPVEVAVKVSNNADSEERVKLLQEAAVMGQFRHARVVQLHGVVTSQEPNMVVIEYISNGALLDYLDSTSLPTPADLPHTLLRFCTEICDGLNYLSKKGFIHRDLAARNILLDKGYHCKIADFGMSRNLDENSYYISKGGRIPLKWTAPEAILYRKYSSKSDVWSYGMVMYEIWSLGHKPFEDYSTEEVLEVFGTGFCLPPPPGCPRGIYSLMAKCWYMQCIIMIIMFDYVRTYRRDWLLSACAYTSKWNGNMRLTEGVRLTEDHMCCRPKALTPTKWSKIASDIASVVSRCTDSLLASRIPLV